MDEHIRWHDGKTVERAAAALEKNGYAVYAADGLESVRRRVLEIAGPEASVAFGGSRTVKEAGIVEALRAAGRKLLLQTAGMTPEEVVELRRRSLTADVYIASPNAVTLDGKLLFVDKIGNRSGAMTFGPRTVIAVAGVNKIVPSEEAGWERITSFAAPVNAKRLSLATPCAVTGQCADCASPQRICNIRMTLRKKPSYTDYHIILVPERLGY